MRGDRRCCAQRFFLAAGDLRHLLVRQSPLRLPYISEFLGNSNPVAAELQVAFGLLVCRDELVAYYSSLGWRLFEGSVLVRQFGETEVFDYNRVMVGDLTKVAPTGGTIDLEGPPW